VATCLGLFKSRPIFDFPWLTGMRLTARYDRFNKRVRFRWCHQHKLEHSNGFENEVQLMEQNDLENYDDLMVPYNDALSDFTDFGDVSSHQTQFNFDDYVEDWLQQYLI